MRYIFFHFTDHWKEIKMLHVNDIITDSINDIWTAVEYKNTLISSQQKVI